LGNALEHEDPAGGGRIFQHRHEQIAHARQLDFARPPRLGPGDERIDAAAVVTLDP
jgi:hypothetical protein